MILVFDFKSRTHCWFPQPKMQRFGAHSLTPSLLNDMMNGTTELIKDWYFVGFIILAVTITTPIVTELMPPLENGEWVILPAVIRGMPSWAFKSIILMIVSFLVTIPMILHMPSDFTIDEEKLLRSGVNPDIIELEESEKGGRVMYDQPNPKLSARRSMIMRQSERIMEVNKLAEEKAKEIKGKHTIAVTNELCLSLCIDMILFYSC